jgi:ferredoxin-nitrate reductase
MDGNTRLCTATAASALKASFGTDGQPRSYADIDHCDTLALFGHNVAETQAVLWMRMLDRRSGPDPPRLLAVDPRDTPVAREADVHLAPRCGTNQALMNGLLREVLVHGWIDERYIGEHTLRFEELRSTVEPYTPERVSEICDVPPARLGAAAELVGTCERLVSTVLQGFYQSNQATAAACQVNNLHLLRGMIGRRGAGVFQMNGQPTSQNTRETGADGDLSGMRNWSNESHVRELAELWNVDVATIPHWAPPTHAMQIWRYLEQGSIGLLWISATNPAVSLPDLGRVRRVLGAEAPMIVVQDLPDRDRSPGRRGAARRRVGRENRHLHQRRPHRPHLGEGGRAARRTRAPTSTSSSTTLAAWTSATGTANPSSSGTTRSRRSKPGRRAREAGRATTPRSPTSGLRGSPGIQWPCAEDAPHGTERLYVDGVFNTQTDYTETYGEDLATGAAFSERDHRAKAPEGRGFLLAAPYEPAPETPDEEFPLLLTTGRTIYHFHTRTKTGRAPELERAAPEVWVELSAADAETLGVSDGDRVRVHSRRGVVEAPARLGGPRPGVVFIPFHYGYWDLGEEAVPCRAANELTVTTWDPASKQPIFKVAAVRVER